MGEGRIRPIRGHLYRKRVREERALSTVSLVRCETYEPRVLESSVRHAVDLLGGISSFVKPGDRVLLKPNLLSAHPPERRITTDPELVRAVCKLVLEAGGRPFIGDSPGLDPFGRVAEKTGMADMAKQLGIELVELNKPIHVSLPSNNMFRKIKIASQEICPQDAIHFHKGLLVRLLKLLIN